MIRYTAVAALLVTIYLASTVNAHAQLKEKAANTSIDQTNKQRVGQYDFSL